MDGTRVHLRDRMVRDAIVEILRGVPDPRGNGLGCSVVNSGLVRAVKVESDRARIELNSCGDPGADSDLVTEVERRVESLPEVASVRVEVVPDVPKGQAGTAASDQVPASRRGGG